jgi:tRNA uridine 5-carboxymethylaminomethyl modification enzyme
MFTSRAEFRLKLRADNADQRLTAQGYASGLVSELRHDAYQEKLRRLDRCRDLLSSMAISPNQARQVGVELGLDGRRRNGHELLSIPGVTIAQLADLAPGLADFDRASLDQAAREALYVTYIERQGRDIDALARDLSVKIPESFHYASVAGLSSEMIAKLSAAGPESLGAAKNIEGVTPAALTAVLLSIKSQGLKNAG